MSMKKLLAGLLFFFAYGISQNVFSLGQEFNVENQIYKVLTLDEWEHAQRVGVIVTELDKKDGFVHLSTATNLMQPYLCILQKKNPLCCCKLIRQRYMTE
jgi:hypothetical protein